MDRTYLRGEIYFARLEKGVGSEQEGDRPVLILQNDVGNWHSPTIIAAPLTSRIADKNLLPVHYYLKAGNGLEQPSIVLLEQIRTFDKRRLTRYIGKLPDKVMEGVDHALAISVGLLPIPVQEQKNILCLCGTCVRNYRDTDAYIVRRVDPHATERIPAPTAASAVATIMKSFRSRNTDDNSNMVGTRSACMTGFLRQTNKNNHRRFTMNYNDVPIWEKYTLTIEEAAKYFRIGEKKLRKLAEENPEASWLIMNGNRAQIKRKQFEKVIDSLEVI